MISEINKIINYSLSNFEKISAKIFGGGELYIKVYTSKPVSEVVMDFEKQNFNVIELSETTRTPKLIDDDIEPGVEFFIDFDIPNRPMLTLISNEPED